MHMLLGTLVILTVWICNEMLGSENYWSLPLSFVSTQVTCLFQMSSGVWL